MNEAPLKPPELKIEPRKLVLAAAIEAVCVIAAVVVYLMTENLAWMVGLIVLGAALVLWVLLPAMRRNQRPASGGSIVDEGRGRR